MVEASIEEVSVLRHLLQLYMYDMSEFDGYDVNDHGLFRYRYLDNYWTEENRQAFIVRVYEKIAGFVLVNNHTYSEEADRSIAEFFIMRKFRRRRIGMQVAHTIFDMHPGCWEVRQTKTNIRAQAFWKSVLTEYSQDPFNEYPHGIGGCDRPIQTVQSRKQS